MSEAPRKEIPLPKGDDDFEDLVLALYRAVWQDPNAKLHGRSGQRQDGVDLYGEDRFGGSGLNGVQCKQHGSATPLKDKDLAEELRAEVEKAKGFQPPLQRFIFATTARRSVTLQQEARDLTELHRKDGLFAVDVLGWEDIEDLLRRHPDVLAWYLDERAKVHGPRLDIGRLPIPGPHRRSGGRLGEEGRGGEGPGGTDNAEKTEPSRIGPPYALSSIGLNGVDCGQFRLAI